MKNCGILFIEMRKGENDMRIVTHENILEFNRLYKKYKTYAAVARATGFCPSTIKKYIIDNFEEVDTVKIVRFNEPLPEFDSKKFRTNDWGDLCVLSNEEVEEIKELWKELEL